MKMVLVPGFKELFPDSLESYDKLMEDIPADTSISLLALLNSELNTPETESEKQNRLIKLISFRFSADQINYLNTAFSSYRRRNPAYQNDVFGRRYLLEM